MYNLFKLKTLTFETQNYCDMGCIGRDILLAGVRDVNFSFLHQEHTGWQRRIISYTKSFRDFLCVMLA
jgi:hypothetical protein